MLKNSTVPTLLATAALAVGMSAMPALAQVGRQSLLGLDGRF